MYICIHVYIYGWIYMVSVNGKQTKFHHQSFINRGNQLHSDLCLCHPTSLTMSNEATPRW